LTQLIAIEAVAERGAVGDHLDHQRRHAAPTCLRAGPHEQLLAHQLHAGELF
jgi:hypothetical protein